MKAITIWQPWASLIILGAKPYEFRGWPAPRGLVGQRIAIHAGARPPKMNEVRALLVRLHSREAWSTALRRDEAVPILERAKADLSRLPTSAVLGTAILGQPVCSSRIVHEFGGPVNDSDRDEHSNWAWPLTDIEAFDEPIPARGAQGFWPWARETEDA